MISEHEAKRLEKATFTAVEAIRAGNWHGGVSYLKDQLAWTLQSYDASDPVPKLFDNVRHAIEQLEFISYKIRELDGSV